MFLPILVAIEFVVGVIVVSRGLDFVVVAVVAVVDAAICGCCCFESDAAISSPQDYGFSSS